MIRYVKRLEALEVLWLLEVSGLGTLEMFLVVAAVLPYVWVCGMFYWGTLSILALQITIPVLFYVFTNGAVWSPSTLLYLFWCHGGMGNCCFMGLCFDFYCRGGCRYGGELTSPFLTQTSFLMLTLLQAMECLLRLGYLQVVGIVISWGTSLGWISLEFSFAKFIIVMGMSQAFAWSCCLLWGWVWVWLLLPLYTLWLGSAFSFCHSFFVPLLTKGSVLGWVGLGWFYLDWGCCLGLDLIFLLTQGMSSSFWWELGMDRAWCSRGCI